MYKVFILLCFFVISNFIEAQNLYDGWKDPIPSSPNAESLGKYGAIPVNYFTGAPNISIPIYTLKTGSFDLPISLSYNAGGIRVDDIASWVGLGWSLNAGGVISVNIKGKSDICPYNLFNSNLIEDCYEVGAVFTNEQLKSRNGTLLTEEETQKLESIGDGSRDGEPDVFNYNFLGYTGQFVLNNGVCTFLSNNNGLTLLFNEANTEFIFTDIQGNKYYFNALESTTQKIKRYAIAGNDFISLAEKFNTNIPRSITAIYLSKIQISNSIDEINFSYTNDTLKTISRKNGYISTDGYLYDDPWELNSGDTENNYELAASRVTETHNTIYSLKLDEISNNRGATIKFNEGTITKRQDLNSNTYPLYNMNLYNNGNYINNWLFSYNYFQSKISNMDSYGNCLDKRLALKSVSKEDLSGDIIQLASFDYYGESETDLKLPYRNCFMGVDYWGYCNADINSTHTSRLNDMHTLFPLVETKMAINLKTIGESLYYDRGSCSNNTLYNQAPTFPLGSSKEANGYYTKSFSLKKINYPTGGYTIFDYEGHQYSKLLNNYRSGTYGGQRLKSMTDHSDEGSDIIKTFTYGTGVVINQPKNIFNAKLQLCYNGVYYYLVLNVHLQSNCLNDFYLLDGSGIGYDYVIERSALGTINYNFLTMADLLDMPEYKSQEEDYKTILAYIHAVDPTIFDFRLKIDGFCESTNYREAMHPFQESTIVKCIGNGSLQTKTFINTSGQIVKKEWYNYTIFPNATKVYGNKVQKVLGFGRFLSLDGEFSYTLQLFIDSYYLVGGKSFLTSKIDSNYFYDVNNIQTALSSTETYLYNEEQEQIKEKNITNSQGVSVITKYTYPNDYSNQSNGSSEVVALWALDMKNNINAPVETIDYKDGKVTGGQLTTYKNNGSGIPMPYQQYSIKTTLPLSPKTIGSTDNTNVFIPSSLAGSYYFLKDDNYTLDLTYDNFDLYGNPLQYSKPNDIKTSYIWGYNYTYPIAEVENAEYNEVAFTSFEDVLLTSGDEASDSWWVKMGSLNEGSTGKMGYEGSEISTLNVVPAGSYMLSMKAKNPVGQTGGAITVNLQGIQPFWPGTNWNYNERIITLSSPQKIILTINRAVIDDVRLYPSDAQMTTYTYDPLVGMTSETAPNGVTTYYEYDGFGRLYRVKDQDGNIIKQYEYHYANQ
ncbi:MAG: hypothetical protein A2W97_12660 [Bacteroidetes bacterium GWE2_40_63]|nr:MAG: hypothetical protein A2W95_10840 [Bacteroidetes bacterium GWA2_40_14]OFX65094.1 MAG: hypothetical protein A2W84_14505 [Bacteroidetes bacterium GWC2_40_13]OFX75291.1 MAG: hypothetical protein A2W96_17000 [Bacteroidetes bacterium GWD2_40_43]OFX89888.1 MAG: hypothetical protein A2W97_12660 [Bacteroidetes bacterium GWE2_40_63]OFY17803.1 MAG: hypothetical protein A2W88_01420 [Bacteroidetes bacterium GWF2_40_13]OFZ30265.1 MAG: hypothetical protein A2437_09635 [Bacteroidetes bacterium RIFOXYC